ncbi:MAG: respiratory nitrate reductase subunit gamma [Alphaproteobacteria bacterium]|jgi:nitrate reductase gamma subunit|nr:respiratory nitrate reductase subunit gamma [Alphaproteobacteria bacterium]
MNDIIFSILFGLYPYVALIVFIFGSLTRLKDNPYSVSAKSSQFFNKPSERVLFIASMVGFHIAIIIILLGHAGGFLTPREMFLAMGISDETHAEIAHIVGGIAAVVGLISMVYLLKRRFTNDRVSINSSTGDKLVLLIIFIQLVLGFITIFVENNMNSGDKVALLGWYFQGLLSFNFSAYHYVMNMPLITLLHLFLGWTLFLILPFTRLIHIITAPLHYLVRTGYQIVRKKV